MWKLNGNYCNYKWANANVTVAKQPGNEQLVITKKPRQNSWWPFSLLFEDILHLCLWLLQNWLTIYKKEGFSSMYMHQFLHKLSLHKLSFSKQHNVTSVKDS